MGDGKAGPKDTRRCTRTSTRESRVHGTRLAQGFPPKNGKEWPLPVHASMQKACDQYLHEQSGVHQCLCTMNHQMMKTRGLLAWVVSCRDRFKRVSPLFTDATVCADEDCTRFVQICVRWSLARCLDVLGHRRRVKVRHGSGVQTRGLAPPAWLG